MEYRGATVGCGRMGAFASETAAHWTPAFWQPVSHLAALQHCGATTPVAAADISAETRARVAETYGVATYADYAELLDRHDIDILTIATRTPEKPAIIRAAVAAGVPALHIEKPLCNTLSELIELQALLADTHVTYGCIRRYLSPYADIPRLRADLALGEPTQVLCNMGRGMLYWTHPHSIDMMLQQIAGAPVAVQADFFDAEPIAAPHLCFEADPWVRFASVTFDNGANGQITNLDGSEFWVVCENGALAVTANGRSLSVRKRRGEDPFQVDAPQPFDVTRAGGTTSAISTLALALKNDAVSIADAAASKRDMFLGQRIMFAMALSHARNGARVHLSDLPDEIELHGTFCGVPA